MIVASRFTGNVAIRSATEFGSQPLMSRTLLSAAGITVDRSHALGLSAIGAAYRLVAGTVACLGLNAWEGRKAEKRLRPDVWQQDLLEQPVLTGDYYTWAYDVAASLEACENALLWKSKAAGRVVELIPINMDYVQIEVNSAGRKAFHVREGSRTNTYTAAEILHIRGHTINPTDPVGVSRITQHADPLGAMVARERFEGKYFANNAQIGLAVEFPQGVTSEQASSWRDAITADHGGVDRAFRPLVVGGGATVKSFPISLQDAQWVDAEKLNVEEAGRIMDVASSLLNVLAVNAEVQLADVQRFLHFQLTPRLRRIESALNADPDLFGGQAVYPLFEVDDLMFADALTRAQVHHQQIQNGTLLVDEARAEMGRPPLPDGAGQVPQIVPVGGAPNPASEPADDDGDEDDRGVRIPSIEVRAEIPPAAPPDMQPVADAMSQWFDMFLRQRAIEAVREQRDRELEEQRETERRERDRRLEETTAAQTEALRQLGNVVVNVEPTPISIENVVQMPEIPVQLTLEAPREETKKITVKRDPRTGLIESATVEEE